MVFLVKHCACGRGATCHRPTAAAARGPNGVLMTAPIMVEVRSTGRSAFGNSAAVADVSSSIAKGEFIAVMVHRAGGKTTTLRMIAYCTSRRPGGDRLWGRRLNEDEPWERETPALVSKTLRCLPFLSVRKNVEFGLKQRGVPGGGAPRQGGRMADPPCKSPKLPIAPSTSFPAASVSA